MKIITTISLVIMPLIVNIGYCDNSEVYKYSAADSERIGYCIGVFGIGTSVAAYYNKEGPLKVYAFQFGKATASYDAIAINKAKNISMDAVKKINNDLFELGQSAKKYLDAHPSELNSQVDACSKFIDPIFAHLSNAGIKLQETGDPLVDVASEMAEGRRKDLGFK